MAGGISINILSNVRAAVAGVEDVADAVEEVDDRLHDLTKTSDKSADALEADLREVQRATDKSADMLKAKFAEAYRSVRRDSDTTADAVRRDQSRISERSAEVGQEVRQNLGEGIANAARGDFESLADTIGDTFGGAVAGIGGVGTAAIAAAGALGLGAIVAVMGSIQEEAKKSEERVRAMYEDFAESGRTFVSEDFIGRSIQDIQNDSGRWNQALERNKQTGIELSVILRAMAGDQAAIAQVHAEYVRQRDEELRKIRESGASLEEQAVAVDGVNAKFGEQSEWISQILKDTGTAADKAAAYRDAMGGAVNNASKVRDIVGQIQDRSITIGVNVADAAFENWWRTVQARAARGIGVTMRPGQGRAWE